MGVCLGAGQGFGVPLVCEVDVGDAVVVAVGDEEAGCALRDADPDDTARAWDGLVSQCGDGSELSTQRDRLCCLGTGNISPRGCPVDTAVG